MLCCLGKQILTKGIVDFFFFFFLCCETARYAQSLPVPDNKLKLTEVPRVCIYSQAVTSQQHSPQRENKQLL